MFKSKKATSIVEVMVIMLIIVVWTVWMYSIFGQWQKLSITTSNRIQAIQISREWLEAMINIRDSNYLLYSANYKDCWNTINYDTNCVSWTPNNIRAGSYKIFQWNDSKWYLSWFSSWLYSDTTYRNNFKVWIDSNWLYTQSWWTDTKPLFTREIKVSYPQTDEMKLTSLVQWTDSSKQWALKVELSTTITNFKNKN